MNGQLDPERYSRQTIFVESILAAHPEFDPQQDQLFSESERELFREVFLPDWDQHDDDYRQAFRDLFDDQPEREYASQAILRKFCEAHGVIADDLIDS